MDYDTTAIPLVTIMMGETTGRFTVALEDDDLVEGDETFTVTLSGTLTGGVEFRNNTATGTIRDQNTLLARVRGPVAVREGSLATYTVELDGDPTAQVVVDYVVGGSATKDVDYTDSAGGKLTIADNAQSGTISLQTSAVANDPADETLIVTLTNVATGNGRALVGSPRSVTTNVVPDTSVIASVAASSPQVTEGQPATFTVTLSGAANDAPVVVSYTVGGSVEPSDYGNGEASGSVSIAAGSATDTRMATITVTTADDNLEEGTETVTVTVTLSLSGQAANVRMGTPTAAIQVEDNDDLTVAVTRNELSVVEGADATFDVTLTGAASSSEVVVAYKVDGAVNTTDYTDPGGVLTIPVGTATGVITVAITDDSLSETREDLTVTLTKATTANREVAIGGGPATIPILASDSEVLASVSDAGTVEEGDDAVFTVDLSGTVDVALTVNFDNRKRQRRAGRERLHADGRNACDRGRFAYGENNSVNRGRRQGGGR